MRVIKKINNNVAQCIDSNGKDLIAFGRGIGFPAMPYELTDLSLVTMTFYRLDRRYYEMLGEIPPEVFEISAELVVRAHETLQCNLNPNLVVGLADHINFALLRLTKFKTLKMPFAYDVEQLYPKETALGKYAVKLIQKRLLKTLPASEITNIAMHFVNAQEENAEAAQGADVEEIIAETMRIFEDYFGITVARGSFQYNRFEIHFRYYLKRVIDDEQFEDDNEGILRSLMEDYPDVYHCSVAVTQMIETRLGQPTKPSELLYLVIHMNRMKSNTTDAE